MRDYSDYMDNISVDTALHDRIMKRVTQKNAPFFRKRIVLRFAGMASCAAVLLLCVLTIPRLFNNPVQTIPYDPADTSIIGLPVDNYSLSDIHIGVEMDRMGYFKLSDFFSYDAPQMFAFVRVIGTEQWKDKNSVFSDKQTSSLQILSVIWSRDGSEPETLSVTQSLYGGCFGDEKTNLLRLGGVYLLPLMVYEGTWYVIGDLDVQFEVDDKGRVWTHSSFEGFNHFDGEDASVVADAVTALTSDEDFLSAITSFGTIARHWGVLVDTTILLDYEHREYILSINDVLSTSSNTWYTWQPEIGDLIKKAILRDTVRYIEQGERYLMFLDLSEGGPYIEPDRVAKINDDGTITAISPDSNIFIEFNGYTVEQMKEEAERAKAWHEIYAK